MNVKGKSRNLLHISIVSIKVLTDRVVNVCCDHWNYQSLFKIRLKCFKSNPGIVPELLVKIYHYRRKNFLLIILHMKF
jgi:hypothetical protein